MSVMASILHRAQQRLQRPTQVAMAAMLEVPTNSLATWMKGHHLPRPYIMARVLERLIVTPSERKQMLESYFEVEDLNTMSVMVPDEDLDRAEEVAAEFHAWHEKLAPEYGHKTRKESAVPWDQVPYKNQRLMIRVVQELMQQGVLVVPAR